MLLLVIRTVYLDGPEVYRVSNLRVELDNISAVDMRADAPRPEDLLNLGLMILRNRH